MALHVLEANLCDNGQNAVGLVTGEHDLYVFPEACHGGERLDALQQRADELGFRFIQTPYGDHDGRRDTHEFVVLARADLMAENAEVVRMGATNQERAAGIGRAAIRLAMQDPANGVSVDIFAVHLDDRRERTRLGQMKTLLNYAKEDCATAIIGDLNSVPSAGAVAKVKKVIFQGIAAAAHYVPSVQPGEAKPVGAGVVEKLAWTTKRAASLLTRLGEMCSGETVTYCLHQGFVDDDHRHRSTMPNSKPLVKLDHMLVRAAVVATLPRKHHDGLSDHRILEGYIAAMEPDLTQAA